MFIEIKLLLKFALMLRHAFIISPVAQIATCRDGPATRHDNGFSKFSIEMYFSNFRGTFVQKISRDSILELQALSDLD